MENSLMYRRQEQRAVKFKFKCLWLYLNGRSVELVLLPSLAANQLERKFQTGFASAR
jgi:hypothetical protein